jgi:hypothetical protein
MKLYCEQDVSVGFTESNMQPRASPESADILRLNCTVDEQQYLNFCDVLTTEVTALQKAYNSDICTEFSDNAIGYSWFILEDLCKWGHSNTSFRQFPESIN